MSLYHRVTARSRPPAAAVVADRAPHARRVMFTGAGHAMLIQDAAKFVRTVTAFTG